jgi:hypothetical protein
VRFVTMFREAELFTRKKSSPFRSLSELLMPIAELRGAVPSEPLVPDALPPACMSGERVAMSIETHEVIDTMIGATEPPAPLYSESEPPLTPEDEALHEIERFRAFALDAIERSLGRLVASLAEEVLGRELKLSPVDLQEITNRALRRYDREGPVRVRVSTVDLGAVRTELPVVADADLREGDLIVEVRDGTLDARMHVRLDCVLRRFANALA